MKRLIIYTVVVMVTLLLTSVIVYREEEDLLINRVEPIDINQSFYIDNEKYGNTVFSTIQRSGISVKCGEGTIEIDYNTGEASFNNGCDPSKASKALWEGIKPFFNMEVKR